MAYPHQFKFCNNQAQEFLWNFNHRRPDKLYPMVSIITAAIKFLKSTTLLFLSFNAIADEQPTLSPGQHKPLEFLVEKKEPIHIEIDTAALKEQVFGKIPVRLHSEHESFFFNSNGRDEHNIFWHNDKVPIFEKDKTTQSNSDRYISMTLNTTDEMVGKKVQIFLEREENLSKVAAVGAFVPQILPILAMNTVTWQPHSFWPTLLRWNYLLLEVDIIRSIRNLIQNKIFSDSQSLFAQCSADFVEGFTVYALLANHGEAVTGDSHRPSAKDAHASDIPKNAVHRSKTETFKLYLRTTPTNRMLSCVSSTVASSLKMIHNEGRLNEVFGKWSMLGTLNDETLEGIAMLMVGYGFNLFGNVPGEALNLFRRDLGFEEISALAGDLNNSIKTSIQYTIHNGYMKFFKGRGWDATSAYALTSGAGLLEMGYRFYQVNRMIPIGEDETFNPLNINLQHQITSIGERAEAIASSGYQLIPLPENIKDYAVPAVAATIIPMASYYAMNGILNYYTTGGLNIALQKTMTSAVNGLVLGALVYVILPHVKEYGAWLTQLTADKVVSWTEAEQSSWIGYFAARDIQYSVRIVIVN